MRLLLLFIFCALIVAGAALGLLMWRDASPERRVEADMAGAHFVYAQGFARDDMTAAGGIADRLSFVAAYPDFAPLAPRDRLGPSAVVITFSPKDDNPDPADRPATLYARFLAEETASGPGGLIQRHFEASSPYDLEQLYLAPPDGRDFFARCPKPDGAVNDTCLSVFRAGAIDVELRYAPALLEHWDALYDGARGLLARMTARRAKKAR